MVDMVDTYDAQSGQDFFAKVTVLSYGTVESKKGSQLLANMTQKGMYEAFANRR